MNNWNWAEYFAIVGVLLVYYVVARWAFSDAFSDPQKWQKSRFCKKSYISDPEKPIDATPLLGRIGKVREELKFGQTPKGGSVFNRARAVQDKREQIAKLSFFQSSPKPPEPPQGEDEMPLLLV